MLSRRISFLRFDKRGGIDDENGVTGDYYSVGKYYQLFLACIKKATPRFKIKIHVNSTIYFCPPDQKYDYRDRQTHQT